MHAIRPLLAAALVFAATLATAQQNYDKVEIKTQKLNGSTYMLIGAGGNIGLSVGDDAVFVIDDQFAPLTPKIEAAIKALSKKPVNFVLNTHWHGDHTGGNANFGKMGALIVAHDNVRKRLTSEQFIEFLRARNESQPKEALPVVTFSQDATFHINGEEILAFHVPKAHTDGDAIIHFRKGNVVHMGDVYFNGMFPFIDYSSGGSVEGVISAVDKVLALVDDKTQIIPGHGPLSNKAEMKAYRDMLADASGRIRVLIQQGKSPADIAAAKPFADLDDKWGKGFIGSARFVDMLTKGMGAK